MYLALSRVRVPRDLCILLPDDLTDFKMEPIVDPDVVRILDDIAREHRKVLAADVGPMDLEEDEIARGNPH
jgi:hypothetical protein